MKLESRILALTCRVFTRGLLVVGVVSRWLLIEGMFLFFAESPSDVVERIRGSKHYPQVSLVIVDGCLLEWLDDLRAGMGRPVVCLTDVSGRIASVAGFSIRVARRIAAIDGLELFIRGR